MPRRLIVIAAVLAALISVGAVASAQESPEPFQSSHVLFLGDCDEELKVEASSGLGGGCFGFALFFGLWDAQAMAEEITGEAREEFLGFWRVLKLHAFNLAHRGQPIVASDFDFDTCGDNVEAAQSIPAGELWGVWIAFFSIEECLGN
jgi:hypothetical protein